MNLTPYTPNQVSPNTLPTPQMPGNDPVAQAGERLGQTIENTGGMMQELARQHQIKADSSVVMDAYANFSKKGFDIQNGALQKKGKDALDFGESLEDYDKAYNETYEGLQNGRQKDLFKQKSATERLHFEMALHRHASEQGEALNNANASAVVDIEGQKLSVAYRDPTQYDTKNPDSQLNKLRASVADKLHMAGIKDNDPAFKDAIDKVTSKAYADRVKLLMSENPKEAKHFLEVHQDEMEPHEVETLKKEVAVLNAQSTGTALAMSMIPDIKAGKSETELKQKGYELLKDDPKSFEHFQRELKSNYADIHHDQVSDAVSEGSKLEAVIAESSAKGKIMGLSTLMQQESYKNLSKAAAGGNKEAEIQLRRIQAERATAERSIKSEAKADAREARRESREVAALNRKKLDLQVGDPVWLRNHSQTEVYSAVVAGGGTMAEVKAAWAEREKLVKKPELDSNAQTAIINRIIEKSRIPENEQSDYRMAFRGAIAKKEKETGKPVTADEYETVGISGVQRYVRDFGFFKTYSGWESKPRTQTKTDKPPTYPADFESRVSAVEKKRNVKFTPKQKAKLNEEYQKEQGAKPEKKKVNRKDVPAQYRGMYDADENVEKE